MQVGENAKEIAVEKCDVLRCSAFLEPWIVSFLRLRLHHHHSLRTEVVEDEDQTKEKTDGEK